MRALITLFLKITVCSSILAASLHVIPGSQVAIAASGIQDSEPELAIRDTSFIREINDKTSELINRNQLDSARTYIDEALYLSRLLNDLEGEAYAIHNLTNYYMDRGLPDSVTTLMDSTFSDYQGTEYEVHLGNNLANAHNMLGNYQKGLEMYIQMRDLAEETGNTRMAIGITQNIGTNYQSLGDIPAAVDNYLQSLEMAEEINDTLIIAVVLDNLGSLNMSDGNYQIAEDYLNQALEMNLQINNLGNQITNHMGFGSLYKEQGMFEESQVHYSRVLEIAEDIGNTLAQIQATYNIGMLKKDMGEYDRALEHFEESLDLSHQNNIPIGFFFNQQGMAGVYAELGDYQRAIELYETALEVAERANTTDLIRGTLENLYQTYESAGDLAAAFPYLKRYTAITDSLSKTNREEALAQQEALLGLRTERENRALLEENLQIQQTNTLIVTILLVVIVIALITVIVLLQKKRKVNQMLREQSRELSKVNEMKDRLLSVLAHDLRTPLSSLQGVVFMIRENVLDKEDAERALAQIDAQLQQDINTLTNYLQWAQTQKQGIQANLQSLSVSSLVNDALFEIKRGAANKGIDIENNVPENTATLADHQMLMVILRNLLSNAIKFVDEGDKISVDLEETGSTVNISIRDTGSGIPAEKQKNLFQAFEYVRTGTSGEKGTGLGLSICKEFTKEQGGSISVESTPGEGTTFTISLQKAEISKETVGETA